VARIILYPRYLGYSVGKGLNTDRDGRYNALEVETRPFKGPRIYYVSCIPLHADNQTVLFKWLADLYSAAIQYGWDHLHV
jgi:hypothetical protein